MRTDKLLEQEKKAGFNEPALSRVGASAGSYLGDRSKEGNLDLVSVY